MNNKIKRVTRLFALFVAAALMFSLAACKGGDGDGDDEDGDGEFAPYPYEDLSVFMELPDYKNNTVSRALLDKMVKREMSAFYSQNELYVRNSEGEVKDGDMVNISYVGYIDGHAFEGGTGMDYDLVIGTDTFISGFEDGLIGMKEGDCQNLNLRFPDDYGYTQYAGKAVMFTVTVNRIYEPPTLTDERCAYLTCYGTVQEMMTAVEQGCVFQYVWQGLMGKCQIKSYPDEYTEYYQSFVQYFTELAQANGQELNQYISENGSLHYDKGLFEGMTRAQFEAVATDYAKSNLVNDLLTYSIIRAEGVEVGDAGYQAALQRLEKEYGMTYGELVSAKGETAVIISILNIRVSEIVNGYTKIV